MTIPVVEHLVLMALEAVGCKLLTPEEKHIAEQIYELASRLEYLVESRE